MDVKGAENDLLALQLSSFPRKNVSTFSTTALEFIKIMNSVYLLPLQTDLELLNKVSKTSSEYFNRTIFNHLDSTYQIEDIYNPTFLQSDPLYP